jgi:DNA-directed RNA polymerase specialized sigma24 family protein
VVRLLTGEFPEDYELDLEAQFPGPASQEAARATALRTESDRLSHEAKDLAASAVAALRAAGLTYREIGTLVGVSHQRAQQLIEERSESNDARAGGS